MHKKVWLPKGLANTLRVNIPTKSAQWYHFMVEAVCVADDWLHSKMTSSTLVPNNEHVCRGKALWLYSTKLHTLCKASWNSIASRQKRVWGWCYQGKFRSVALQKREQWYPPNHEVWGFSHWAVWCSPPVAWCFHPSVQTLWGPTWPETWLKRLVPSATHAHTPLSAWENGCTRRSYWQHNCWCFREGIVN